MPARWRISPALTKEAVSADPERHAREAAPRWNAVVALKGATTYIATPDGDCWRHDSGQPGLGTSGSGDVLAGIIVGLAARGAPLAQAAVWGVALHARAGRALAERLGPDRLSRERAAGGNSAHACWTSSPTERGDRR